MIAGLCDLCDGIDFRKFLKIFDDPPDDLYRHHKTIRDLEESANSCALCAVLFDILRDVEPNHASADPGVILQCQIYTPPAPRNGLHIERLEAYCNGAKAELDVFTDKDNRKFSICREIMGRRVLQPDDYAAVKQWISTCQYRHERCNDRLEIQLSTRLIDVGSGVESTSLTLIESASWTGPECDYIALSHCWGKRPMFKTTKSSLEDHKKRIPWDPLPKTFKDAIGITRVLGVRFIWIDSLCIIQDDLDDWEMESAAMASVYSQSYITIAATSSEDGNGGCLIQPPELPLLSIGYPRPNDLGGEIVHLRKPLKSFFEVVNQSPLNRRAWVCQERFLSPRILHVSKEQRHWECRESCVSEDGCEVHPGDEGNWSNLKLALGDSIPSIGRHLQWHWYEMLDHYTGCGLANLDDRLPALSGLASNYASRTGDEYVAGLWKNQLAVGLNWSSSRWHPYPKRAEKYRAPSWSWAAVDGPTVHPKEDGFEGASYFLRDAVVEVEPAGKDLYGQVAAGKLTCTVRMRELNACGYSDDEGSIIDDLKLFDVTTGQKIDFLLDDGTFDAAALFFVQIYTTHKDAYSSASAIGGPIVRHPCTECSFGLLLQQVAGDNLYRRIGTAEVAVPREKYDEINWFADMPWMRISII